ncbi:MAG: glutathione S-transferase C-terminal domain-containing protein [Treponema sp.]|jgi:glutathionyl-hydroquinone reductase|nr:glutathione S-transferase C-terminal domain-containing protein [Treponema sp.]
MEEFETAAKIETELTSLLRIGEDVSSVGVVNPVRGADGQEFSLDPGGVDPVLGIRLLPEAYDALFVRLDALEERLGKSRYLFVGNITDIRLYVTLIQFDYAYYNAFRVNRQRARDFPNLWRYTQALYQIPSFGENTLFDRIKRRYHA